MSVITEVTPLEGIDLEGSPSCEHYCPYPRNCGQPSEYRIRSMCMSCGDKGLYFTCARCHLNVTTGNGLCGICFTSRGMDGYC